MRRATLLRLALAAATPILARPARANDDALDIACAFEAGRIFVTPRLGSDDTVARFWLDTSGSGFVFEDAVARWNLPVRVDGSRRWTRLPPFHPANSMPRPLGRHGELAVFDRSVEDRANPILAGFDGQLGASWFQGRVWRLDYLNARVRVEPSAPPDVRRKPAIPLRFPTDAEGRRADGAWYPSVRVEIDGERLDMSFDIAATVALTETAVRRLNDSLPPVRATSFVTSATARRWRERHPDWPIVDDASVHPDIVLVRVPRVGLEGVQLGPVWFSTRHADDVFEGETVAGKLGANAYDGRIVVLDYPGAMLWIA